MNKNAENQEWEKCSEEVVDKKFYRGKKKSRMKATQQRMRE